MLRDVTQKAQNEHLKYQGPHQKYGVNDARVLTVLARIHVKPHISDRKNNLEFLKILSSK